MPDYAPPDGRARVLSYHSPGPVYAYLIEQATDRGVSRNMAITEILTEHMLLSRDDRRKVASKRKRATAKK